MRTNDEYIFLTVWGKKTTTHTCLFDDFALSLPLTPCHSVPPINPSGYASYLSESQSQTRTPLPPPPPTTTTTPHHLPFFVFGFFFLLLHQPIPPLNPFFFFLLLLLSSSSSTQPTPPSSKWCSATGHPPSPPPPPPPPAKTVRSNKAAWSTFGPMLLS